MDFNPRSPCGERPGADWSAVSDLIFQSTLPLRGATTKLTVIAVSRLFQSTLPLRGATQNVHPLSTREVFQSTLPLRGATFRVGDTRRSVVISIHAPLAGSDDRFAAAWPESPNFNPRSPCGERPSSWMMRHSERDFNPRSPCGERPAALP